MLSAILLQNPRFHASMTSPAYMLCTTLHEKTFEGEFSPLFDDQKRSSLLTGIFKSYYADTNESVQVVFDTNRAWTGRMALLAALYPKSRVICCVRDVPMVVDSFERALQKNPLHLSRVFNMKPGTSVYARVEALMHPEDGAIGRPLSTFREAWFGDFASRLVVIRYESLARNPKSVIAKLYEELEEDNFEHDFGNLAYSNDAFDENLGMPGLHRVRPRVSFEKRETILPPDIVARLEGASFWRNPQENMKGVTVL